ncbi:MAG TPA: hypothetical protein VFY69_05825 [Solirubrobacterales bacterium]|nr:hypothetical protein [Solirubrobacterales bacterium]
MSKTAASRIAGEGTVPLRGSAPREEEPSDAPVAEEPVPLRLGAERVESEERAARLRILTGRRRWR